MNVPCDEPMPFLWDRENKENPLKNVSLIYYMVKKLKEKYPDKQISKSLLQKLFFLFGLYAKIDLNYTSYYNGPYSSKIAEYISMAETLYLIRTKYTTEKGYFIKPLKPRNNTLINIGNSQDLIDKVIDKYGEYTLGQLIIITLAIELKYKFNIKSSKRIINAIADVRPKNNRKEIKQVINQVLKREKTIK